MICLLLFVPAMKSPSLFSLGDDCKDTKLNSVQSDSPITPQNTIITQILKSSHTVVPWILPVSSEEEIKKMSVSMANKGS